MQFLSDDDSASPRLNRQSTASRGTFPLSSTSAQPMSPMHPRLTVGRPSVVILTEDVGADNASKQAQANSRFLHASANIQQQQQQGRAGMEMSFVSLMTSFQSGKVDDVARRGMDESQPSLQVAQSGAEYGDRESGATEASAQRQQFLTEQRRLQRAFHWYVIVEAARFVTATLAGLKTTKAQARARDAMVPRCLLGIRRAIRRARLSLMKGSMKRPMVTSIRNDKMLGLFSEAHIQYLVDKLEPRYFFPNEAIIFMGCEDDECYVLHTGSADVMMGKTQVFTMTSGMVFGSVGMISGEPRTATIIAREGCLVWSITRKVFESYGARDHQVAAAQTIIRELRQKNIRSVYKGLIDPEYLLSKFYILHRCSLETVAALLAKSEPRVLKHGEILQHPEDDRSGSNAYGGGSSGGGGGVLLSAVDNDMVFVLRGKVRIMRETSIPIPEDKCLEEHLTFLVELASKRHSGDDEDIITKAAREYTKETANAHRRVYGSRECITELSGPMLINVGPLLLGEVSPLVVETIGGCDILVFSKESLARVPLEDEYVLRQNALNIHCPFIKPLGRTAILRTIFSNNLSFDFLSKLQTGHIRQEPFVFSPGTRIFFGLDPTAPIVPAQFEQITDPYCRPNPFVAILVLSGEISCNSDSRPSKLEAPFLWPDVTITLFGCERCEAVCNTKVEAIRLNRADILEALLNALNEAQLETFCSALTTSFVARVGRKPYMEVHGVHPTKSATQARWKHLISVSKEAARAARPVHVVQPPLHAVRSELNSTRSNNGKDSKWSSVKAGINLNASRPSDDNSIPAHNSVVHFMPPPTSGSNPQNLVEVVDTADDAASYVRAGFKPSDDAFDGFVGRSHVSFCGDEGAFGGSSTTAPQYQARQQSQKKSFYQGSRTKSVVSTSSESSGSYEKQQVSPKPPPPRSAHTGSQSVSPRLAMGNSRPPTQSNPSSSGPRLQRGSIRPSTANGSHYNSGTVRTAREGPVIVQKASSGAVTMKFAPSARGKNSKDRLHQELAEFFM